MTVLATSIGVAATMLSSMAPARASDDGWVRPTWPARPASSTPTPLRVSHPRAGGGDDCSQPPISDAKGDSGAFDIIGVGLTGDCTTWTLTTTLARPLDLSRLNVWVMEINTDRRRTGCRGTDRLVLAYVRDGRLVGQMLAVSGCDADLWTELGTVRVDRPDKRTLRATIPGWILGPTERFRWWVGVDRVGDGGFDAAPDSGSVAGYLRPPPPNVVTVEVEPPGVAVVTWQGSASVNEEPRKYTVTITKEGSNDPIIRRPRRQERRVLLSNLGPGRYTVSVVGANPMFTSDPTTVTFLMPERVGA